MKKILLLGGSAHQIPAIDYAKEQGYYTVLCDFLPDNPGQYFSDIFYCVSTTDKNAVLEVAKKEKIDGIVSYASDPAAPIAAYVAEKMDLPTNPYKSVEVLAFKDKFREFLKNNNFNYPDAKSFNNYEDVEQFINLVQFPVIVKPIDSSGSKGVNKAETKKGLKEVFKTALAQSRSKNIIVEKFIVRDHPYMIAGDCFVVDGKVEYWGLLNSHRDSNVNPFVPVGTSYPIAICEKRLEIVKKTTQRLFDLLDIKFGAFNVEIMFDDQEKMYFVEVGPRNGGNMIPELLYMTSGVDLIAATIETCIGNKYDFSQNISYNKYIATHVLHTEKNGIFKEILIDKEIEGKIVKKISYKQPGDLVQYFDGSNKAIGMIFWKFDTLEEMIDKMENYNKWIKVIVE